MVQRYHETMRLQLATASSPKLGRSKIPTYCLILGYTFTLPFTLGLQEQNIKLFEQGPTFLLAPCMTFETPRK